MSLQKSHPVRTLLWSGHELTVKSIISCEAKCHAKVNGKDDEKLHFEPKVSVFWKCLLTTGIKLYILLHFIELPIHHTHTYIIHYLLVNIKGNKCINVLGTLSMMSWSYHQKVDWPDHQATLPVNTFSIHQPYLQIWAWLKGNVYKTLINW